MKICCKSRVSYKLVGYGHAQNTYFILLIYSKVTKLFFFKTGAVLFFFLWPSHSIMLIKLSGSGYIKFRKCPKTTCNSQDQHRCSWSYSTDPNSYTTSYFLLTADKYTPKPGWYSILLRSAPIAYCIFLVPWNGALLPSIQNEVEILFNFLCFIPFGIAHTR